LVDLRRSGVVTVPGHAEFPVALDTAPVGGDEGEPVPALLRELVAAVVEENQHGLCQLVVRGLRWRRSFGARTEQTKGESGEGAVLRHVTMCLLDCRPGCAGLCGLPWPSCTIPRGRGECMAKGFRT